MRKIRVAVLMGGISKEREISLSTGRQVLAALDKSKYTPEALDPASLSPGGTTPARSEELRPLDIAAWMHPDTRPDVAFIALHGKGGEDGTIQGLLELVGIPYTGSGVLASALAMDKVMSKRLFRAAGLPVPEDIVVGAGCLPDADELVGEVGGKLGFPVVVKPSREGSTIGCTIVDTEHELWAAVQNALAYDHAVLVETFLKGVEITAGLLGNEDPEVLPLIEIVPRSGFYDYEAKYAPGGSVHIIPARISEAARLAACDYARRAHQALGCRGMSRVDMIVVGDQPWLLEVNTIPGMTPTSLLPEAARAAGIEFPALLDRIIQSALMN